MKKENEIDKKIADEIIETIIEPLLKDKGVLKDVSSHGVNGILYFHLQNKLCDILGKYIKKL